MSLRRTLAARRVSESGEFTATKNGNLVGSLTLADPADEALDCPNGQTATLFSVVWSNVTIEDLGSGAFLSIKGTFSA